MEAATAGESLNDVGESVRRWVLAGIVTAEQGEAIVSFERSASSHAVPSRRLTPVAELVSYLGIVLVISSGCILVNRMWHGLGFGGRLAVGVVIALLGFIGGGALMRLRDESAQRLAGFLWFCGTGGVATTVAVLVDRVSSQSAGWTMSLTGLCVALVGGALWRDRNRPLQFLSTVAGLVVAVSGLVMSVGWHPGATIIGIAIWSTAAVLAIAAQRWVRPSLVATLVAQSGFFIGGLAMSGSSRALGVVLGLVGSSAGVGLGLTTRRTPVVAAGVVSFFAFVVRLLSIYLKGPATILVAFLLGVVLVTVAVWRTSRSRHQGTTDRD